MYYVISYEVTQMARTIFGYAVYDNEFFDNISHIPTPADSVEFVSISPPLGPIPGRNYFLDYGFTKEYFEREVVCAYNVLGVVPKPFREYTR